MYLPRATRIALAGLLTATVTANAQEVRRDSIPLPEHPRPDFERAEWVNLNGRWDFAFDKRDEGERAGWSGGTLPSPRPILVPFSWGAPASGVPDSAEIGWYARSVTIPERWRGRRVYLVVGASDWRTSVWLDGAKVGEHQGGYVPFSVELTAGARYGAPQRIAIRVDDRPHAFKLEGKQGYGQARGMWQTVYLEARGSAPLASLHFTPDLRRGVAVVDARLAEPAPRDVTVRVVATNVPGAPSAMQRIRRGATSTRFELRVPNPRLWSLEDPFLHEVSATVAGEGVVTDSLRTYFGMRTVSVTDLPGTRHPYVAINGKPVYLQLALDQAYHPTGFYTFPTDSFTRMEILRARQIGLNGLREHIKIETPRKLYWADKLGMLIMADVPNWWGPPTDTAFREHEAAMRAMIDRDYNHPSVFSWVAFNEAWGLVTKVNGKDVYLPETQRRVAEAFRLAKSLDATRLVEDNSPCCGRGHTETDINSWHEYLPGWEWEGRVRRIADSTFAGSTWNFEKGYAQARQPMMNSEFGNVWGYTGSTGDVDWSWDYHRAVDAFRRHPALAGWLYTEHHDVINEWNGYWRFDRSKKETGVGELVEGMTLRDFHSPYYVAVGGELSTAARAGASVSVPLWASLLADDRPSGDSLTLRWELYGWNSLGERRTYANGARAVAFRPYMSEALAPLAVTMPDEPAVAVLAVRLEDRAGSALHHNFTTFVIDGTPRTEQRLADGRRVRTSSVAARDVSASRWSRKAWTVLDGLKVNGTGAGYVEYRIPWPAGVTRAETEQGTFLVEASAKQLYGKDRDTTAGGGGDYMRGGGLHDPSRNRNAYPMTGERQYPSAVTAWINGRLAGRYELADDPADHRGILSWHSQLRDKFLREAGSYGELLRVSIPAAALDEAARTGQFVVRLEVPDALPGGLAIYGAKFGRYPLDPTVALVLRGGGSASTR